MLRALRQVGATDVVVLSEPPENILAQMRAETEVTSLVPPRRRGQHAPWNAVRWIAPALMDRVAHNLGSRAGNYRAEPAIREEVQRLDARQHYDVIVTRYLRAAAWADLLDDRRLIVDLDDIEAEACRNRLANPETGPLERWVVRRHLHQLESILPGMMCRINWAWVVKNEDLSFVRPQHASVLPNIPLLADKPPTVQPSDVSSRNVLFVGVLAEHTPNVIGLDRFIRHVWPRVVRGEPRARLRLVGRDLHPARQQKWNEVDGVEAVGFVPDLAAEYASAALTIAPVAFGSGTNVKVLESLLYGRTAVISPEAHRGFTDQLQHGPALHVAREPMEYAERILALLKDVEGRHGMERFGLEAVRRHYTFEHFAAIVAGDLQRIIASTTTV